MHHPRAVHAVSQTSLHRMFDLLPWFALATLVPLSWASSLQGTPGWAPGALLAALLPANAFLLSRWRTAQRIVTITLVFGGIVTITVLGNPVVLAVPPIALAVLAFAPLMMVVAFWGLAPGMVIVAGFFAWTFSSHEPLATILGTHLMIVGLISGVVLRRLLAQADRVRKVLADLALVDTATGLGNLRSLRRDFVRYKALAARTGRPLLLSRWQAEWRGGPWDDVRVVTDMARALEEATRQSDAIYALGHYEFVGLHLGIDTAAGPAQRIRSRHPEMQVSWSPVGTAQLDPLLDEVRGQKHDPSTTYVGHGAS